MESDCARAIRFYNWAVLYMATATLEAIARRVREEREAAANGGDDTMADHKQHRRAGDE